MGRGGGDAVLSCGAPESRPSRLTIEIQTGGAASLGIEPPLAPLWEWRSPLRPRDRGSLTKESTQEAPQPPSPHFKLLFSWRCNMAYPAVHKNKANKKLDVTSDPGGHRPQRPCAQGRTCAKHEQAHGAVPGQIPNRTAGGATTSGRTTKREGGGVPNAYCRSMCHRTCHHLTVNSCHSSPCLVCLCKYGTLGLLLTVTFQDRCACVGSPRRRIACTACKRGGQSVKVSKYDLIALHQS